MKDINSYSKVFKVFSDNLRSFHSFTQILRETHNIKFFQIAKRLRSALIGAEKLNKEILLIGGKKPPQIMEHEDLRFLLNPFKHITEENLEFYLSKYYLVVLYSELEQYLFNILKYIYVKHPEILKRHTIYIGTILDKKSNIDLIIEEKAEKDILDLFYKDFKEFFKEIAKKPLGLKISLTYEEIIKLNEFKQLRNSYIHGDGRVSLTYLSKFKNSKKVLGEILELNYKIITEYDKLIFEIIRRIDEVFVLKFPELKIKKLD